MATGARILSRNRWSSSGLPGDGGVSQPYPGQDSLRVQVATFCFGLLVLFNIALPKGGIRLYDLPVTWGYVVVALVAPLALVMLLRRGSLVPWPIVQTLGLFAPVAALIYYKAQAYNLPLAGWFPYFVLFGGIPAVILIVLNPFLEDVRARRIESLVRLAIRFAVLWGLANFLLHLLTGLFVEIPYITVNGSEVGETLGKNNMRGSVMKLVSTYNNGNIFGICMVMLAPLYFLFEKRKLWLAAFLVAILCSLSRTAWFGLTIAFALMVLFGQIKVTRVYVWLGLAGALGVMLLILPLLGWTWTNIFDSNLGGRREYFDQIVLSAFGAPQINLPELLYVGLLQSFGIIGFFLAFMALAIGPLYGVLNWPWLSPIRRAATLGAMAYMACAVIDGAFVFPPTLVLYLFLAGLIYRRGFRPAASADPALAANAQRKALSAGSVATIRAAG